MNVTVLGSGTSSGVPVIGCSCHVCTSNNTKDNRLRSSILIKGENQTNIVIDTSVEFRIQAIRADIRTLSAILFTHTHADHVMGLDDIRPMTREEPIPLYGTKKDMRSIRKRFDYAFKKKIAGGGVPKIVPCSIKKNVPVEIGEFNVLPLEIFHGNLKIYAYRINDFAYLTDCSRIPDETMEHLYGLKVLIIGALRKRPHPTHFSFAEAVSVIEELAPEQSYFTHLSHHHTHNEIVEYLKKESDKKIEPAFDGLSFQVL